MERSEPGGWKQRTDLRPLHIVQPEGVSFKMDGHELEWQNWKMHIGIAQRFPAILRFPYHPFSFQSEGGDCIVHCDL